MLKTRPWSNPDQKEERDASGEEECREGSEGDTDSNDSERRRKQSMLQSKRRVAPKRGGGTSHHDQSTQNVQPKVAGNLRAGGGKHFASVNLLRRESPDEPHQILRIRNKTVVPRLKSASEQTVPDGRTGRLARPSLRCSGTIRNTDTLMWYYEISSIF